MSKASKTKPDIRGEFRRFKDAGDYAGLGWWFWRMFMTLPKGKQRTLVSDLWKSLTRAERAKCEGI